MKNLRKKIISDPYNSIIFEKGRGKNLFLVGGYVRDILKGIISKDRDYVLDGNIESFVNEIIKTIRGTVVEFKKGETIRIAFKDGITLDFSKSKGTLEEDLSKRDFTINAIAWSPETGIVDPYDGLEDVKNRKIRSLSEENLVADPLRMLRAYRFAAEINGTIESKTRKTIKRLHNLIKKVSSERITLELLNLLDSQTPAKYIKMAFSDGILRDILSIPDKALEGNIKAIYGLEARFKIFPLKVKVLLRRIFSQNLTYKGLLRLELLLMQGHYNHKDMNKIRMSNIITKRILLVHRGIEKLRKDKLFDLFLESNEAGLDILILKNRLDLIKDYKRFTRIWKKGILSSEEIVKVTKIKPGPALGKIIIGLKKAQFKKLIKNRRDALKFIKQF